MRDRYPDIVEASFNDGKNLLGIAKMGADIAASSPIFKDVPWIEASGRYGHETTVRTGPLSMHRAAYTMGRSTPGDWVSKLFYGNPVYKPGEMCGFSAFYDCADPTQRQNGVNIIDAGCAGGSSVWLVHWHPALLMVGYPKGSEAGLGEDRVDTALCISDWRRAVRIANIGPENADRVGALMVKAIARLPHDQCKDPVAFYIPERVNEWFGKPVLFYGIKVRTIPQLRDDEPRVV